ncbi:hypothetical protein E1264_11620 [Actinomadura sp. KC216]|uniref:hypothetical protein n=1 Tax=Actinomadura sp. KC216 TaxID=2530370 RepID=UPI0010433686|nr:hypothetical protein [Actinomadura sp. KC216]TDB88327.1 hypothetical protein E1264_11620 [Actinomadura sp. KC216]
MSEPMSDVHVDRPHLYFRSPTGMLHLRARIWPDDECGPVGNGLSFSRARCGWETDLGLTAIPSRLFPDGEDRLCKRCVVIES